MSVPMSELRKFLQNNHVNHVNQFSLCASLNRALRAVPEPARDRMLIQLLENYQPDLPMVEKSKPLPHHEGTMLPYIPPRELVSEPEEEDAADQADGFHSESDHEQHQSDEWDELTAVGD